MSNNSFTKVSNTIVDSSSVISASSVLSSFEVIQGTVDLVGVGVGDNEPFLNSDGSPIILSTGDTIVSCTLTAIGGNVATTTGTLFVGLAAGPTTTPNQRIINQLVSENTLNGAAAQADLFGRIVGADRPYLVAQVATAIFTAGVVQASLLVVR